MGSDRMQTVHHEQRKARHGLSRSATTPMGLSIEKLQTKQQETTVKWSSDRVHRMLDESTRITTPPSTAYCS